MHGTLPPTLQKTYAAFLFDMDGTIINSIASAERCWSAWAVKHGLDVATFLPTIHGVRGTETITRLGLPGVDPVKECQDILDAEMLDLDGIVPIPGAIAFLKSLPRDKWAIVTSAPLELALRRLEVAGMPLPDVMVTGESVVNGKPNPECFLLGAAKLGVDASECLVFEDAIAGILAGESAGATIMVITSTHAHLMETELSTIPDYTNVKALTDSEGRVSLQYAP